MNEVTKLFENLFGWVLSAPFLIICGVILFFMIYGVINDIRSGRRK